MVVVGPSPGVESAAKRWRGTDGENLIVARVDDVAGLPDRWWGWEGVDTLFINNSQPEVLGDLSAAQTAEIAQSIAQMMATSSASKTPAATKRPAI